jgi:hypothetical protein
MAKKNKTEKTATQGIEPKAKKKTVIISVVIGVLCAGLGGAGGYVLFNAIHPAQDPVTIHITNTKVYSADDVKKSLAAGTLDTDYADKAYEIIAFALDQQADNPYTLTIGKGTVYAAMNINQEIVSATYNSPSRTFNQNVSSSSLVHTAARYYDAKDGKVSSYVCSVPDDWTKSDLKPAEQTYDEFLQAYGKLHQDRYYCTTVTPTDDKPIPEAYLTSDKATYEASTEKTKHEDNGVVIYAISKSTVQTSALTKNGNGYQVSIEFIPKAATSYYAVQMKTTGGLVSRPTFSASSMTVNLDTSLNLIDSVFTDEYHVTVAGITTGTKQVLTQYYFHSQDGTFSDGSKSVTVSIPEISDVNFNGYDLFPEKTA